MCTNGSAPSLPMRCRRRRQNPAQGQCQPSAFCPLLHLYLLAQSDALHLRTGHSWGPTAWLRFYRGTGHNVSHLALLRLIRGGWLSTVFRHALAPARQSQQVLHFCIFCYPDQRIHHKSLNVLSRNPSAIRYEAEFTQRRICCLTSFCTSLPSS